MVECVNSWKDIQWIRIKDIESLGPEAVVFAGKIEPNDIKQGQLGDCYFLSSLSVLTEYPERVRKLFVSEEINRGIFAIKQYKDGEER